MNQTKKRDHLSAEIAVETSPKRKITIKNNEIEFNSMPITAIPFELLFEIAEYYCCDFKDVVRFAHAFSDFRCKLFDSVKSEVGMHKKGHGLGPFLAFLKEKPLKVIVPINPSGSISVDTIPVSLCQILKNVVYVPQEGKEEDRRTITGHAWGHSFRDRQRWISPNEEDFYTYKSLLSFKKDSLRPLIARGFDPISLDIFTITPSIKTGFLRQCVSLERLRIGDTTDIRPEVGYLTNLTELKIKGYHTHFYDMSLAVDRTADQEHWPNPYEFEKLKNLKSFRAKNYSFTPEWLQRLPTSLRHLSLTTDTTDSEFIVLDIGHLLENLESFRFCSHMTHRASRDILRGLKNVKDLRLEWFPIRDKELMELTGLERLSIKFENEIGFSGYKSLTNESLKRLTRLKRLEVEESIHITEEGLKHLTELEELNLKSCFNFCFTEELAQSLKKLKKLGITDCCKVVQQSADIRDTFLRLRRGESSKVKPPTCTVKRTLLRGGTPTIEDWEWEQENQSWAAADADEIQTS